jgi:ketosteroid isomerase-like protein
VSANLDLVRSIYAGWERGDFSSTEWADGEIEVVMADGPAPGRWKGLGSPFREVMDVWAEVRVDADEYRELDGERVLVLIRRSGRGRASGLEIGHVQTKGAHLFHVHGGKVTRFVFYWDRELALAAFGLDSEDCSDS